MSLSHSPLIVTDGLVLCLDAANRDSYPTTGTTWYDLSGNGNHAILTNGPTYNSNSGGYISCDGVNDYAEVTTRNTNLEFQPTQPFSVFCWVYNLSAGVGYGAICANMDDIGNYTGWDLWVNTSTEIAGHIISAWSANAVKIAITFDYAGNSNKWVNIGYTYNGSCPANSTDALNSVNFYVNGIVSSVGKRIDGGDGFNSISEITTYNASQRFRIASRWKSGSWSGGLAHNISNTVIYNRSLSAAEVLQNFNAMRRRFGV